MLKRQGDPGSSDARTRHKHAKLAPKFVITGKGEGFICKHPASSTPVSTGAPPAAFPGGEDGKVEFHKIRGWRLSNFITKLGEPRDEC